MILMIEDSSLAVAASTESPQNIERRLGIQSVLIVDLTQVLKARFIHDLRAKDLRVADLQSVLGRFRVVTLRGKVEGADTVIVFRVSVVLVASRQRIVLAQLIINSRGDVSAVPQIGN